VDTGAARNCINSTFARRLQTAINPDSPNAQLTLNAADGKALSVVGTAEIEFSIAAYMCEAEFVVVDNLAHNVIIGLEALNDLNAVVDLSTSTLSIANNLVTVPLIQRFPSQNILRTVSAVTIDPMHELRET